MFPVVRHAISMKIVQAEDPLPITCYMKDFDQREEVV